VGARTGSDSNQVLKCHHTEVSCCR